MRHAAPHARGRGRGDCNRGEAEHAGEQRRQGLLLLDDDGVRIGRAARDSRARQALGLRVAGHHRDVGVGGTEVLAPRDGAVRPRRADRCGGIGQKLRSGQRRRISGRLKVAMGLKHIADVDRESGDPEKE